MGIYSDRGKRVASYLRSRTGFPLIHWNYPERGFEMPFGYSLSYTTCRNARHAVDYAKALRDDKGIDAVVYGFDANDIEDTIVLMPLRVYTELLGLHLNVKHLKRVNEGE